MTDTPDSTAPAVGAGSSSGEIPAGGGRARRLTLAGALFIVAGFGGAATLLGQLRLGPALGTGFSTAFVQAIGLIALGGLASTVGNTAAYVVLWRAGFPHRGRAMAAVTLGIAVSYTLVLLVGLAQLVLGSAVLTTAVYAVTAAGGMLLLVFAIAAARNRLLPLGFRIVPAAQFALVVTGGVVALSTGIDPSGVGHLAVGVAYVVLASNTAAALHSASVATAEQRTGRRSRPPVVQAPPAG